VNDGGQQLVSKVCSAFCNSRPPDAELRFLASYVHEAEQDAGGVKMVVSADNVSVCSAPAMVVRSLPFQAVVQNTVERKEMVTHSFRT
jgi:hypothetical protein